MEIEKRGQDYHISLGEGEKPRDVLRSVAVASFESARAAGMGWLHYDNGHTFTSQEADAFIAENRCLTWPLMVQRVYP